MAPRGKKRVSQDDGVEWIGAPIHMVGDDQYYAGFARDGVKYHVGEVVALDAGPKSGLRKLRRGVFIAEIESLWQDCYDVKWAECRWYYYPEEAAGASCDDPHEVIESDHMDENELAAIVGKATVLTEPDFRAKQASSKAWKPADEAVFYAKRFYDPTTKLFRSLHGTVQHSKYSKRYLRLADEHDGAKLAASRGTSAAVPPSTPTKMHKDTVVGSAGRGVGSTDKFSQAACQLQLSAAPKELPCRDTEKATISDFLDTAIRSAGVNHALYISGMPGTGKTATVREVVRQLNEDHKAGDLPPFQYIEINAMHLPSPYQLYSVLWRELAEHDAPAQKALQCLQERFSAPSSRRQCTVLLVDELDYLVTRKQTVLYNLFEWPTMRHSRLVVVGIANTMDLPERLLPKVLSRLGLARVVFSPYTRDQIRTIIKARLEKLDVFKSDAIELAAGKVAALSGDIRRALQICRRSAEIAGTRAQSTTAGAKGEKVTVHDINAAAQELATSQFVQAMQSAADWERGLLTCLYLHLSANGCEEAEFESVYHRMKSACLRKVPLGEEPTFGEALAVMYNLAAMRLIKIDTLKTDRYPRLSLCVQLEDVEYALREDPMFGELFS